MRKSIGTNKTWKYLSSKIIILAEETCVRKDVQHAQKYNKGVKQRCCEDFGKEVDDNHGNTGFWNTTK